jgi:hypothetical protein
VPPGQTLARKHARPDCPVKLANRRGTTAADYRAAGRTWFNVVVDVETAGSVNVMASELGSSNGEIAMAGYALLAIVLSGKSKADMQRTVSGLAALAAIVDSRGTDDDWRKLVELRDSMGLEYIEKNAMLIRDQLRRARS